MKTSNLKEKKIREKLEDDLRTSTKNLTESSKVDPDREFEVLKGMILDKNKNADIKLITKAYELAKLKHDGQKRANSDPYIIHPIEVAKNIVNMNLDDETICAGLLHDVLEDTDYTHEQMREAFGDEITFLVDGVTKLKNLKFKSDEEKQAENMRKLIAAMSNDIRVILIKLADRLHNMKTLNYKKAHKQVKTAKETKEIYVKFAILLGIDNLKWQLEDECLKYLDPKSYHEIASKLNSTRIEREEKTEQIVKKIKNCLYEKGIYNFTITGRPKSINSIYEKIYKRNVPFEDIYDLTAVRIIVEDDLKYCYEVMGALHSNWKILNENRYKNYLVTPKMNGYKSIHTTLIDDDGTVFEAQIRTKKMHEEAENGICAHWLYKDNQKKVSDFDSKLTSLGRLISWVNEEGNRVNDKEYMDTLKVDFFSDEIYVYSPKGSVFSLPKDSTPIDFAYEIHTDIGNSCVGAKVNGKMVPLNYQLKNDEIVEILTSKNSASPSKDWLTFVKTNRARNKIRQFLKKVEREKNIELGKSILINKIKEQYREYKFLYKEQWLKEASEKLSFNSIDDMLSAIGFGSIPATQIIPKLKKKYNEINGIKDEDEAEIIIQNKKVRRKNKHNIRLRESDEDIDLKLAKCCSPVPGDDIVGYITIGRGITIHRKSCPNIKNVKNTDKIIEAYWDNEEIEKFPVKIEIKVIENKGILYEMSKLINNEGINILAINSRNGENNTFLLNLIIEIKDTRQLDYVLKKLKSQKFILDAYRVKT